MVPSSSGESLAARFDRLLTEHGPGLRRLASVYARHEGDAEDLFQDICVALWSALPRFRGDCSERTFLYRIGHNRGINERTRRRLRLGAAADLESIPDPGPDPDLTLTLGQRRERLLAAVRRLEPIYREVVLLALEGFSNVEAADVLGTTDNNVAVRLNRARRKLRDLLDSMGGL